MELLRKNIQLTNDKKIFFASDYHFWHTNVIKFDKRPFLFVNETGYEKGNLDVLEMNESLIKNWNDTISPEDEVYYLGDFAFASRRRTHELAWRLNGKINIIAGNHDRLRDLNNTGKFKGIYDYGELWIRSENEPTQMICMSHYPMYVWNKHHTGSWMLHGHCHNSLRAKYPEIYNRKIEDMGANHWDYKPVEYRTLKVIMDSKSIETVDHHGD